MRNSLPFLPSEPTSGGFAPNPEGGVPVPGRRRFLETAGACLGAWLCAGAVPVPAPGPRKTPNILLIVAEDMGPHLGCYGDRTVPTPNLNALARDGVLFSRAYVTQASCSPSRSSILTGLYPHESFQLGLAHYGYTTHHGIPNLPGILKEAGYRTGVVGKIHVNPENQFPFDRVGPKPGKKVREFAAEARSFIRESEGSPFFLYVNFGDCHKPFERQVDGLPETPVEPQDVGLFPVHAEIDDPRVHADTAGYYNGVMRVDLGVCMLDDVLRETGTRDNTLVMVIGDHGPPMTRGKTTCYEFGTSIPFLMRLPGRSHAGTRTDALISTVDILPTCAEAAGIPCPKPVSGMSLLALLQEGDIPWRDTLCTEWHTHGIGFTPQRAIRDSRYKLILNLRPELPQPGRGVDGCPLPRIAGDAKYADTGIRKALDALAAAPPVELYDLLEDPREFRNLAEDPAHAEIRERLTTRLQTWRETTRDPLLDPAVFASLAEHHARFAKGLPERKRREPERKRFTIDMVPFRKDWAAIRTTYE